MKTLIWGGGVIDPANGINEQRNLLIEVQIIDCLIGFEPTVNTSWVQGIGTNVISGQAMCTPILRRCGKSMPRCLISRSG